MPKSTKPGEATPSSGQYRPVDGGGRVVPGSGEITSVEGHPMPPTPGAGQGWKLVDKTKHKR